MRAILASFVLAASLVLTGCEDAPAVDRNGAIADMDGAASLATVPLRITTSAGIHRFTMEVAVTPEAQEQGLMNRESLPQGEGMLFPFTLPRMANFWMKDTPLPLDLLFVTPGGTIAAIREGKPEDLTPISANEPVSAVLEITRGEAARLGIREGDRVQWGDCRDGQQKPGEPINPMAFCPAP